MFTILNINRVDGEAGGEYIVSCHAELVSAGVKGNEYIVSCHAELVSASYQLIAQRHTG